MSSKKIEPTDRMIRDVETWGEIMGIDDVDLLRYILNHPDAPGLLAAEWKANAEAAAERAEHAEDRLADSVHVDEAARRVEAAREQGWDDAADWVKRREAWTDEELRAANPHRPASALPTDDGAVIVPAEGRMFIRTDGGRYFTRLTYSSQLRLWYGVEASGGPAWAAVWYGEPEKITLGTWRAA